MSFPVRGARRLLVAPLVALPLLLAGGAAQAAPATPADLNLYASISGLNVCVSRSAGVDFDKAVRIAAETIASVLQIQHQSQFQTSPGKTLTPQELLQASATASVVGAANFCPQQIPPEVMKKVEALVKQAGNKAKQPAPSK